MRGVRTVVALAVVTLVAVGAVLFVERGSDTTERSGEIVFPALLERGKHRGARAGDRQRRHVHPGAPRRCVGRGREGTIPGGTGPGAQAARRRGGDEADRAEDEQPRALSEAVARGPVRRGCEVGAVRPRGRRGRGARELGARRPPALEVRSGPHRALCPGRRRPPGVAGRGFRPGRAEDHRLAGPNRGSRRPRAPAQRRDLPRGRRTRHGGQVAPGRQRFRAAGHSRGPRGRVPVPHQRHRALSGGPALRGRGAGVLAGLRRPRGQARAGRDLRRTARPPRLRHARRRRLGAGAHRGRRHPRRGARSRCRRVRWYFGDRVGGRTGRAPPTRRGSGGSRAAERTVAGLGLRASVVQAGTTSPGGWTSSRARSKRRAGAIPDSETPLHVRPFAASRGARRGLETQVPRHGERHAGCTLPCRRFAYASQHPEFDPPMGARCPRLEFPGRMRAWRSSSTKESASPTTR